MPTTNSTKKKQSKKTALININNIPDNGENLLSGDSFKDDELKFKLEYPNFTKKQADFHKIASSDECKLIIVDGPAGSGKTYLSMYCALKMIKQGKVEDLLYLRSAVESSDNKLGFLPGSIDDKLAAYTTPLEEKLEEFLSISAIKKLRAAKRVISMPINYLRGVSWKNRVILLDETQNLSTREIKTFMTRIGENCKVFVLGDHTQSDIGSKTGFKKVFDIFDDEESKASGIYTFKFGYEDIMRSELCKFISQKFDKVEKLMR